MRTRQITSFTEFCRVGLPYRPRFDDKGRLLLTNLSMNDHDYGMSNKARFIICNVVVYNRCGLTAIYTSNLTRFGFREYWSYYRDGVKLLWGDLSLRERWLIVRGYLRALSLKKISHEARPPSRVGLRWFKCA